MSLFNYKTHSVYRHHGNCSYSRVKLFDWRGKNFDRCRSRVRLRLHVSALPVAQLTGFRETDSFPINLFLSIIRLLCILIVLEHINSYETKTSRCTSVTETTFQFAKMECFRLSSRLAEGSVIQRWHCCWIDSMLKKTRVLS